MNKKFFTLIALAGLFVSFGANAQNITSGNYYYLNVDATNDSTLVLKKNAKGVADSLVAVLGTVANDSALWKVDASKDLNTGFFYYKITNKATGTVLSFGNSNNSGVGVDKLAGTAMTFTFGQSTIAQEGIPGTNFYAYIANPDSVLQLSIAPLTVPSTNGTGSVVPMKVLGNTPVGGRAIISFVKPAVKMLTANELNAKLSDAGFQIFAKYAGTDVTTNNPFYGKLFYAVGMGGNQDTTAVALRAANVSPKLNKSGQPVASYAYLDTTSYSAANSLPAAGERMLFRVDTLPLAKFNTPTHGITADTTRFTFTVDPSSAKDSVYIDVEFSINFSAATNPLSWLFSDTKSPVQIDALAGTTTDKYVLTTAETTVNTPTIFSFAGTYKPILDLDKVYSVKNVNTRTSDVNKGKYLAADLANDTVWVSAVQTHVPATQFVYNGFNLLNRENELINTGSLYEVSAGKFTNAIDTFEVTAMDVDIKDVHVGYKNFTATDMTNKGYTFDYLSGILSGRSISMSADSSVIASDVAKMVFKMKKATTAELEFGPAANTDGVVKLARQAYYLTSKDGKKVVAITTTGKLFVADTTSVNKTKATPFFFREIETATQYILTDATTPLTTEYANKYNVNSTTAILEKVGVGLANNAFAINDEMAAPYVLDAKGHYEFMTPRGEGLTANVNMFAAYRKVGELKVDYTEDDFKLYVDTAKVSGSETKPLYYILKGAEADGSKLAGNFLRVMADSMAVETYVMNVEGATLPRLKFIPAIREVAGDSLLLTKTDSIPTYVTGDSIGFKNKTNSITQFRFRIKHAADESATVKLESEYVNSGIGYTSTSPGFVAVLNNVIYLSKYETSAMLVEMSSTTAPTANDDVIGADAVSVSAVAGAVIVKNAADKVVSIVNVLGQTIAKKTVANDYDAIPAPAGVVFVTIEGATFKVLVK